jgi:membrane dipeptidase
VSSYEYSARAIELVKRAMVIDMLSPLTLNFPKQAKWFADPETFTAADLQPFRDSGISVFHIAVGNGGPEAYLETLKFFAGWNGFIAGQTENFMRIDSPADFDRVKSAGKVGVLLGLQNSDHFRSPADVDFFRNLGQRVSQLTYNSRNWIGNGSTERRDEGISDFGATIIERMNKVGMAVDVSHCGDRTTLDAFELSRKPVLITHSNCRALAPGHPRCKTDEAIKKVGAAGSVMGITGVRMFVKNDEPTTIEDVLNHFDHVRKLIGPEHLGVGSDIDLYGYDAMPPEQNQRLRASYKGSYGFREKIDVEGINHPRRMFDLTEGLIRRQYSDRDIEGILGGNFKRVLTQIWTV